MKECKLTSQRLRDYSYEILGLKLGASKAEVKEAYRTLAKRWHPDQFTQDEAQREQAEAKIKLINNAYQWLKHDANSQETASAKGTSAKGNSAVKVEVKTRSTVPWEYYENAKSLVQQDRLQEATEALGTAIRLSPDYADAYRYRGLLYSLLNFDVRAGEDARKAEQFGMHYFESLHRGHSNNKATSQANPVSFNRTTIFDDSPSSLHCVAVSPNQKLMAAAGKDGVVYLWNFNTQKLFYRFQDHTAPVNAVVFSQDSQFLFSASQDATIKIWHLATGTLLKTLSGHSGSVTQIAVGQVRELIVSSSLDGSIRAWNLKTGQLIQKLLQYTVPTQAMALTQHGSIAICGSDDGSIRMCHVLMGGVLKWFNPHNEAISAIALSGHEQCFAVADQTGRVSLYEFPSGKALWTAQKSASPVRTLAFIHNNSILVSGGKDAVLQFWDVATGSLLASLSAHDAAIGGLSVAPDADTFLSASADRTVKVWQLKHL